MTKFEFDAIGTKWVIDITKKLSQEEEAFLLSKIKDRITKFDIDYSRFRQDSLVTKMSKESGEYILPDDADKMISLYRKIYDISSGSVTPLIGQVLVDAGYDAEYSLKVGELSKPPLWNEVMTWDKPKLTLKKPTLLDFGAGGKGYLVDIVSDILEEEEILDYCVDAGGDMRHRSTDSEVLKVGLENPQNTEEIVGILDLSNKSLCGSAGNRRRWENFHHIINPETLSSPKHIEAVWVVSESTLLSDLLTTALFFVLPDILLEHFKFEYLILNSDFTISKSEHFNAELFVA
ncbi:MAG: FAD:protein FMN transferase [Parcubacteria group bacterium]